MGSKRPGNSGTPSFGRLVGSAEAGGGGGFPGPRAPGFSGCAAGAGTWAAEGWPGTPPLRGRRAWEARARPGRWLSAEVTRRLGKPCRQEGPFAAGDLLASRTGSRAAAPKGSYRAEICGGARGCGAFPLDLDASAPAIRERPRPRAWTARARDARGRECLPRAPRGTALSFHRAPEPAGRRPPPSSGRSLFGWGGPGGPSLGAPPPRSPLRLSIRLAGATKFRPTLAPCFLHFYVPRLRDDKTLQMF